MIGERVNNSYLKAEERKGVGEAKSSAIILDLDVFCNTLESQRQGVGVLRSVAMAHQEGAVRKTLEHLFSLDTGGGPDVEFGFCRVRDSSLSNNTSVLESYGVDFLTTTACEVLGRRADRGDIGALLPVAAGACCICDFLMALSSFSFSARRAREMD